MFNYKPTTTTGKQTIQNLLVPTVIDKTPTGERVYDIFSRLLEDRIIFMGSQIYDEIANSVIAQLLFLEKQDPKKRYNHVHKLSRRQRNCNPGNVRYHATH